MNKENMNPRIYSFIKKKSD